MLIEFVLVSTQAQYTESNFSENQYYKYMIETGIKNMQYGQQQFQKQLQTNGCYLVTLKT